MSPHDAGINQSSEVYDSEKSSSEKHSEYYELAFWYSVVGTSHAKTLVDSK